MTPAQPEIVSEMPRSAASAAQHSVTSATSPLGPREPHCSSASTSHPVSSRSVGAAGSAPGHFSRQVFGSLHSDPLDQALATLDNLEVGGQLVMLVSHLRRLAAQLDQVVLVKGGDMLRSRGPLPHTDERDALPTEDVRCGLAR